MWELPWICPTLQKLSDCDSSPSKFEDKLQNFLYGSEYMKCRTDLQDDDLVWLVDSLDKVRFCIIHSCSLPQPAQALDRLSPFSAASRNCLRQLGRICKNRGVVPTSCTVSASTLILDEGPLTYDAFGDVYCGTLDGVKVRAMCLRGPSRDTGSKQVRFFHHCPLSQPSSKNPADPLQRRYNVETLEAPEHCTLVGCHHHALSVDLALDVWRRLVELRQEKPRCRPTWTCGFSFCHGHPTLTLIDSCLMSQRASTTFTLAMWFTEMSKGYVALLACDSSHIDAP